MNTFMIRQSALQDNCYYIDFDGEYEIAGISRTTGITENEIHHIYEDNHGVFTADKHVYYFEKRGNAADAVESLNARLRPSKVGKTITLTEEEIEYIRKALINEDSNIIYTNTKVRDGIFDKLNRG